MLNMSSFRYILVAASSAVVLFMLLDEGSFGARAEPAVSLKYRPRYFPRPRPRPRPMLTKPAAIKKPSIWQRIRKPVKKPKASAKPPAAAVLAESAMAPAFVGASELSLPSASPEDVGPPKRSLLSKLRPDLVLTSVASGLSGFASSTMAFGRLGGFGGFGAYGGYGSYGGYGLGGGLYGLSGKGGISSGALAAPTAGTAGKNGTTGAAGLTAASGLTGAAGKAAAVAIPGAAPPPGVAGVAGAAGGAGAVGGARAVGGAGAVGMVGPVTPGFSPDTASYFDVYDYDYNAFGPQINATGV